MSAAHTSRRHAIVIGGSLGGLLAARALSTHFEQVTILERDPVALRPEARKGQPQARHLHALLAGGLKILRGYFPDLPEALAAGGAIVTDMAASMNWYTHGGYRQPFRMGQEFVLTSRPFLEHLVRERVLARNNITLFDNSAVQKLLTRQEGRRVTGVQIERRALENEVISLAADLVVDASGRGSRTPQWLAQLGYQPPTVSEVRVNVGYATQEYRRTPGDPLGSIWTFVTPEAPRETRLGGLFPVEGNRWILTLSGWGGDHAPADPAGFLEFARSLPAPDIYNVITRAKPLGEIVTRKFPSSLRRHYEKLHHFPMGYLVLGDAVSSFNPIYGQGMTSAAQQARALDTLLAEPIPDERLATTYFRRIARIIDIPWQLAVGEDFRYPQTTGPKPAGVNLLNRYVTRVHRATLTDPVVGAAFLRVMNLLEPPASLFRPSILLRVLRPARRSGPTRLRPHVAAAD